MNVPFVVRAFDVRSAFDERRTIAISSERRTSMTVKTVGVVGAGTMGNGIAQVFAQAGYASGSSTWRSRCSIAPGAPSKAAWRSSSRRASCRRPIATPRWDGCPWTSLDALASADFVVEAIVEDADAKSALFAGLDALTGAESVLASNTSSISITLLGAATKRPDKVLGMHFMNPVPLMTLVELIRGQATSDESMAVARDLCVRLGKTAVEAADYPGFIANRILMPMINEAIFAVMEGVGTPEAIDTVMKLGMNHPMGPLALADLHRPRRLPGDPQRAARGAGRSEVPALSAAAPDGRRRSPRPEVGPRLLHVRLGFLRVFESSWSAFVDGSG